MAIWVVPSIRPARTSRDLSRDTGTFRTVQHASDPPITAKWHPRTTLLFILTSSGLLWAALFAVIFYLR
jgi:hypothetical protein